MNEADPGDGGSRAAGQRASEVAAAAGAKEQEKNERAQQAAMAGGKQQAAEEGMPVGFMVITSIDYGGANFRSSSLNKDKTRATEGPAPS